MANEIERKISFYTELLKILSAFIITVGGGIVGLLYRIKNPVTLPLLVLGIWFEMMLVISFIKVYLKIKQLLEVNNE